MQEDRASRGLRVAMELELYYSVGNMTLFVAFMNVLQRRATPHKALHTVKLLLNRQLAMVCLP